VSTLLIHDCSVLHIPSDRPEITILDHQNILVRGSRIEAIQPTGQVDRSQFAQVIDARGMLAAPGLINTHAHTPMVLFRGLAEDVTIDSWFNDYIWRLEHNLIPDDVRLGMLLGLAEMIEAGVTTVAEHYFHMHHAARAVEAAGTRGLLGWATFGSGGMDMLEESADFVREWQGAADGRIRTLLAPHAPYTCSDEFLSANAELADQLGVGIHIHAAETMDQTRASLDKRGQTPLQVLEQTGVFSVPTILAHVCGALPDDIDLMAKYGAGVAHAPKTYLKLAMDMPPLLDFRRAGIPIGLASDGAVSNNTMNLWESLRLMAMLQKDRAGTPVVMPIAEALYIATRDSARVVGLQDEIGALEAGYLADIVLIDFGGLHHQPLHSIPASLVYNMEQSDVRTVIVNGQVLMRDRQLLTIDKAALIAEARERMPRLSRRDPEQRIQSYNP
jgi:5-methylthioadenosine/S-adenosylhomocysteine deaminase